MERKERWRLLKALAKASNAFHRSMEESGYRISYGLGEKKGSILDSSKPIHESWPIGSLSIEWQIEKESETG